MPTINISEKNQQKLKEFKKTHHLYSYDEAISRLLQLGVLYNRTGGRITFSKLKRKKNELRNNGE